MPDDPPCLVSCRVGDVAPLDRHAVLEARSAAGEKAFRERWKGHRNKRRGDGPSIRAAGMKPGEVEAYWR